MTCSAEVHVGDVGTQYRVRILDDGVDFDPSDAPVKRLIFLMPGGVVLVKEASVETDASPATRWFLTYTVQQDDGAGSPPDEFHAIPGKVKVQAYLEWASPYRQFHSDIQTVDENGVELQIWENLN